MVIQSEKKLVLKAAEQEKVQELVQLQDMMRTTANQRFIEVKKSYEEEKKVILSETQKQMDEKEQVDTANTLTCIYI